MAKAKKVPNAPKRLFDGYVFKRGLIDKGGRNMGPSAITERPPPPQPIATLQSEQASPPASNQAPPTDDSSPD